jgi:multicomponent Na+:H+ antiporter subunit C
VTYLLATVVAVLYGVGVYLLLQRTLTRIIVGLALLGHGANLLLLLAGGPPGLVPILGKGDEVEGNFADPLPQALVLTAVVIGFGVMAFMLALSYRSWALTRDDEVEDDIEDRRIARHEPSEDYTARGADRPPIELEKVPD